MLEWGGENIEQSLRCWMCGGEIVVERTSQVGHIFFRPQPPNKVKPLTVPRNKARVMDCFLKNINRSFFYVSKNKLFFETYQNNYFFREYHQIQLFKIIVFDGIL